MIWRKSNVDHHSGVSTTWLSGDCMVHLELINLYLRGSKPVLLYMLDLKWFMNNQIHRIDGPAHYRKYFGDEANEIYSKLKRLESPDLLDEWLLSNTHPKWFIKSIELVPEPGDNAPIVTPDYLISRIKTDLANFKSSVYQRWFIVARELNIINKQLEQLEQALEMCP